MTTEPTQKPAPMPVGGAVMAIVPQSLEEIQRMANTAIAGGLAPASLVKWPKDNDSDDVVRDMGRRNLAAVSGVLMAGAELGVPPMAALRMFTSINGRVALYADGNVAVVRRARDRDGKLICEYIRQGYVRGDTADTTYAWCEAKRADNGEIHREEFSVADAMLAGLWDAAEFKRAKVWRNGVQGWHDDVPNDSAWHRYPKRMMLWRATGYALRWLFADVLAGMVDEFEAREIEGFVDITPSQPQVRQQQSMPPTPPPEEDENQDASNEEEKPEAEAMTLAEAEVARQAELAGERENPTQSGGTDFTSTTSKAEPEVESSATTTVDDDMPPVPPVDDDKPEPEPAAGSDEWFAKLELLLAADQTEDAIEDTWNAMDVDSVLSDTSEATMDRAHALKHLHLARIGGQGDLLSGGGQ